MMLGEQVGLQDRLFYEFNLEDRVPNDHLLRLLDAFLDIRVSHPRDTFRYAGFGRDGRRFGVVGESAGCGLHRRRRLDSTSGVAELGCLSDAASNGVPDHPDVGV